MTASVIVPVWNHWDVTTKCLTKLRDTPGEVIVIDNGSTDRTPHAIRRLFPWVKYFRFSENQGFPKAINFGMKQASGDVIVLLNNDAAIMPKFWTYIKQAITDNPTAVIGQTGGVLTANAKLRTIETKPPITYVEGYVMVFTRETLNDVGEMDEAYSPAYFEDSDWCIRAAIKGHPLILEGSLVRHSRGITSRDLKNIHNVHRRNYIYFKRKWAKVLSGEEESPIYIDRRKSEYVAPLDAIIRRSGALGDVIMASAVFCEYLENGYDAEFATSPACVNLARMLLPGKSVLLEEKLKPNDERLVDLNGSYERLWGKGVSITPMGAFAQDLGIRTPKKYPELTIPAEAISQAQHMLKRANRPLIAVSHHSPRHVVCWDFERMAATFDLMKEATFVLLSGTKKPQGSQPRLRSESIYTRKNVLDLTGKTSIEQMAAVVSQCDCALTVDTLLSHMAAALHIPTVLLSASPLCRPPGQCVTFPGVASCFPCYPTNNKQTCPRRHCLSWITPKMIANAIEGLRT